MKNNPYSVEELLQMDTLMFNQLIWLISEIAPIIECEMGSDGKIAVDPNGGLDIDLTADDKYLKCTNVPPSQTWLELPILLSNLQKRGYISSFELSKRQVEKWEKIRVYLTARSDINDELFIKLKLDMIEAKKASSYQENSQLSSKSEKKSVLSRTKKQLCLHDNKYYYNAQEIKLSPHTDAFRVLNALCACQPDSNGVITYEMIEKHICELGAPKMTDRRKRHTRISHALAGNQGILYLARIGTSQKRLKDALGHKKPWKNVRGQGYMLLDRV